MSPLGSDGGSHRTSSVVLDIVSVLILSGGDAGAEKM